MGEGKSEGIGKEGGERNLYETYGDKRGKNTCIDL